MSFPILMTGVTPAGQGRVPLHPDDAARFEADHQDALAQRGLAFQRQMQRLDEVARIKRQLERGAGPIDQQATLNAAEAALSSAGWKPESTALQDFNVWATSQPESRNAILHANAIPENLVFQTLEALSADGGNPRSREDIAARLGSALPGAFYPPAGYAVETGRDRLYESGGPVAGLLTELAIPDVVSAGVAVAGPAGRMLRSADNAFKTASRAELVDEAGNVIRRLRLQSQ